MSRHIKIWSFADIDRSGKVRWTANELGYEITEERVEFGQHRTHPYLSYNPYGQIPTVELDGQILVESTAICLALAERHPQSGLIPGDQDTRDLFWQSVELSTTTLEAPVVFSYLAKMDIVDAAWRDMWAPHVDKRLGVFAASVPEDGYICGAFSLADICAAYVLRIAVQAELLTLEGKLERYLRRLMARPAIMANP